MHQDDIGFHEALAGLQVVYRAVGPVARRRGSLRCRALPAAINNASSQPENTGRLIQMSTRRGCYT